MPARNIYHDAVVRALEADGWTITDDPLRLTYGGRDLYVDLGAQRATIGAERNGQRIAVEIQSFLSDAPVRDLQEAVGQYIVYRSVLSEQSSDRLLYMAVSQNTYDGLITEKLGQLIVRRAELRLVVFDQQRERIVQWIPSIDTEVSSKT